MHFHIKIQLCQRECGQYAIKCHAYHKICNGETYRRLGDRFREHLRSTRLSDSDLPIGGHFASPGDTTQYMLVSNESSFEAMVVSMWTLILCEVSARCKRCDFYFYLSVTFDAFFSVAFKPMMKREYPQNVWLIFQILVRKFELSFPIHWI